MSDIVVWNRTKADLQSMNAKDLPRVKPALKAADAIIEAMKAMDKDFQTMRQVSEDKIWMAWRAGRVAEEVQAGHGEIGRGGESRKSFNLESLSASELGVSAPDLWRWKLIGKLDEAILRQWIEDQPKTELISLNAAIVFAKGGDENGDEWYTPSWLFESLGLRFSMDVCAPMDRTHVATPAKRFLTEVDDGLSTKWTGTVWCNPPYSTPEPWALKCISHGNGLLLVHMPMNAEWCVKVWEACAGIRLFQAMEFVRPDGTLQRPGYWLQLAAFGETAAEALAKMTVPKDVAENPRRVPSPMWVRA